MKGLILKDILNLRKTLRTTIIIGIAYSILFSNFQPAAMLGIIMILFMMQTLTSFSYDDYSKWNCYALSLPITKKQLVLSKYLLSFIFLIIGLIVSFILTSAITLFNGTFEFIELGAASIGCFSVMTLMIMILLPLIYKFGIERARLMLIGVFAIPTILILIVAKLINGMDIPLPSPEQIEMWTKLLPYLIISTLVLCTYISYKLSLKIVSKKEY